MISFKIRIEERALNDIQQGFDYYEEIQVGLGVQFNNAVFHAFDVLVRNPYYQVRYDKFRCLLVKRFPYMIHYEVNETNQVIDVFAVINTNLDPKANWLV
jgi:plasmid stabilization system protein ParE